MPDWIREELEELRGAGLFRERRSIRQYPGGWCEWNGKRLKNFAGNDYLDLAHHPQVIRAAQRALEEAGAGSTASQLVCGRGPWHESLEQELAIWQQAESALLFPTGYAANVGTICALAGKQDTIFSDELNHASLIDGCRLSGANICIYPHRDLEALGRLMRENRGGRQFIVTDTLFSMDGDIVDLKSLSQMADESGATLILDEAHAIGAYGNAGAGLVTEEGLELANHVRIGTLSKALGSLGGFVTGSRDLTDWLWNRARSQIFSTTLPASACAAAEAAIQLIRDEPARQMRLRENSQRLIRGLRQAGQDIPAVEGSPVVPLLLNVPELALKVGGILVEEGYLVAVIRPPSVPRGTSRLRITLSSGHQGEEVDGLLGTILDVLARCGALTQESDPLT